MNIYQLDANGYWTGAVIAIGENQGAPVGWVLSDPPELGVGEYALWSGRWSVTTVPPALDVTPLIAANNAQYSAAIDQLTSDYPPAEIATWERQRAEAVAWGADPAASTPWIDIAAAARGLDRDEYLARTLAKVTAFAGASAYLTGRRQGIDDQIRAATTAEELAAIVIDYTLPGA